MSTSAQYSGEIRVYYPSGRCLYGDVQELRITVIGDQLVVAVVLPSGPIVVLDPRSVITNPQGHRLFNGRDYIDHHLYPEGMREDLLTAHANWPPTKLPPWNAARAVHLGAITGN